jgi:hypothetical protein
VVTTAAQRDLWHERHRYCEDDPSPIDSFDEARYILGEHSGHGGGCLLFAPPLARPTQNLA